MLNIFQYQKDITEINDLVLQQEQWKAVCPSPQKSDMFREIINELGLGDRVQVITISKFVNDILALAPEEDEVNRVGKSQLLMDLWTLWKIKVNNDYEKYRFCFDLFTEIRSYSLGIEIIEDIKDLIEEQYYEGLLLFNAYFDTLKIVDEQKSYQLIGNYFDKSNLGTSYLFWGYDHLNSNQIDMLKSMGELTEIVIPLASNILSHSDNLDWPTWLTTDQYKEQEETVDKEVFQLESYEVPKGRLSEYAKQILTREKSNIIHIDKTLSLHKINSLYKGEQNFKVSYDLFDHAIEDVFSKLNEEFKLNRKPKAEIFSEKVDEIAKTYFKQQKLSEFKVALTLKKTLSNFIEQSELNEEIEVGDLKCVREILSLDLPRSSFVSLVENENVGIYERDFLLRTLKEEGDNFLFIEQSSSASLQDSFKFSNELMSVLSAFGPLQSKKYEVLNLKNTLENFFQRGGKLIFESGAFENSVEWEDIFKHIELDIKDLEKEEKYSLLSDSDLESQKLKRVSATRVQSYIDCPRKYYLDYVNKLDINARSKDIIGADIKGVVEHDVIENYVSNNSDWDESTHKEIIETTFEDILKTSGVTASEIMKKSAEAEIIAYTTTAIRELLDAKKELGIKYKFEVDVSQYNAMASGRIDLLLEYRDKYYVFDFKRSSFGIPSKTEFESFSKIQIWYYMKILKDAGLDIGGFGYVNLSEIETSLLYNCDSESILFDKLFSRGKVYSLKQSIDETIESFNAYFDEIINKIETDKTYIPEPKNSSTCSFCMAGPVCPKSEVSL
jgi:hypothetical protein